MSPDPSGERKRTIGCSVSFVSTESDGQYGIGTYTEELRSEFSGDLSHDVIQLRYGSNNPIHVLRRAIRAARTDSDHIHIQHEYGLFGTWSLWSWLFFPLVWLIATYRGRTIHLTIHDVWEEDTLSSPLRRTKWAYMRMTNLLLVFTADHFVFLSPETEDRFIETTPSTLPEKSCIAYGAPTNTRDIETQQAKEMFVDDPSTPLIIEPGYIRTEKGYEAFLDLAEDLPEYQFLVAGGTPPEQSNSYKETVEESAPENLSVTGYLDDEEFHAVFNAADIAVLPYRDVTQSAIFHWCIAYEIPVVGSTETYFERMGEEYDCLVTATVDDRGHFAERIWNLLRKPEDCERLASNMRKAKRDLGMDQVAATHRDYYEQEWPHTDVE